MAAHDENKDQAAEVTARNVARMRELMERKKEEAAWRPGKPPLTDDPHVASQADELAQDPSGTPGDGGGIRNLGGGRS